MHIFRIYATSNILKESKPYCKKKFPLKKLRFFFIDDKSRSFLISSFGPGPSLFHFLFLFSHNLKKSSSISQAALDVPPRRVARRCFYVPPQSAGRRPGQQHRRPRRRHRGRGWRAAPRCSHHTVGEPLRRPAPTSQPQVLSQGLKGMEEDALFSKLTDLKFSLMMQLTGKKRSKNECRHALLTSQS
jgi:hypothetical protein